MRGDIFKDSRRCGSSRFARWCGCNRKEWTNFYIGTQFPLRTSLDFWTRIAKIFYEKIYQNINFSKKDENFDSKIAFNLYK